jgi:4-amino-4-deoxy-L-arabinose transferase-like glycosyltransferase
VASNGLNLYVDEAQYWYWAQDLAWGYYSKPPMIAVIIAATTGMCGDGEFCVRAGSLLLYPLSTWLLFLVARKMFDPKIALLTAVLFITLPAVSLSSTLISTDVALFFFWTLALYAFVFALDSDAWDDWILLGVALGLGMLSKYTMGIFPLSALVYVVAARRFDLLRNPRAWLAVLVMALIFAPNLWWNWQNGFPTFQHTADIAAGSNNTQGLWHWDEFGEFLGGQLGVFGLLLFPLLLWVIWRGQVAHKTLLLSFALPFLLIIMAQALLGRANANWAAPTYVAATVLVAAWLYAKWKTVTVVLVLNLALGLLVYHPAPLNNLLNTDLYKRLKGWDVIGAQYREIQQHYPEAILLADGRDVLSSLAYYARPEGLRGVSWNPQHLMRHHYDLVTRLDDKRGEDFLLVTPNTLPAGMERYFESVHSVGQLQATIHLTWRLHYNVYLMKGFKELNTQ